MMYYIPGADPGGILGVMPTPMQTACVHVGTLNKVRTLHEIRPLPTYKGKGIENRAIKI